MLTEDHLRELIDSAASHAPTPAPLADDQFHIEVRTSDGRTVFRTG